MGLFSFIWKANIPEACSTLPYVCSFLASSYQSERFQPPVRKVSVLCSFIRWEVQLREETERLGANKFISLTVAETRHGMPRSVMGKRLGG